MGPSKKIETNGSKDYLIVVVLIFFIGISQGALFFYRVKPALDMVALVAPLPEISVAQFVLLGISVSVSVILATTILSFVSFKMLGSELALRRSFILLGRSLLPWLVGVIPLSAFSTGSYFIHIDNLSRLIIIPWFFYLWGRNVKKETGFSTGQAAAGIMLAVSAFILLLTFILFAILLTVGASLV